MRGNIKVSKMLFPRNKNVTLFSVRILNENRMTPEFNLELIGTTKILFIFLLRLISSSCFSFEIFVVFANNIFQSKSYNK